MDAFEVIAFAVLFPIGALGGTYCLYMIFWGKCNYCGSSDIVHCHGYYFYCNKCRRKV